MPRRPMRPCRTPGCGGPAVDGALCLDCTARHARAAQTVLVCGPPCAGKNTLVEQRHKPGDLVVDLDALLDALGGRGDHDQPERLKPAAFDARDAVIDGVFAGRYAVRAAWIIQSAPTPQARAELRGRGARVVLCLPSIQTCLERAEQMRPPAWTDHVRDWFGRYQPGSVDEVLITE